VSEEVGGKRRRPRRRVLIVCAVAVALLAADLARAPADQLTAAFLLGGIDLYQGTLSKALPALGVRCRFQPTCSHYAEASIRRHGALVGTARAAWRVMRCGPWTPAGTVDPP
jgi:putative membrane protein insertion efficiency factor